MNLVQMSRSLSDFLSGESINSFGKFVRSQRNQTNQIDQKDQIDQKAPRSKVSRLYHVLKAIDVEPVACRVKHADRILPFQEFLEQLRDGGLPVSGLGQ